MPTPQISLSDELWKWVESEARERIHAGVGFIVALPHQIKALCEVSAAELTDAETPGERTKASR